MLEGWYYDDALMEEVASLVKVSESLLNVARPSVAEICVFIGIEPLYQVNPSCNVHGGSVVKQRGDLGRIGAPFDLYSLGDLERVDPLRRDGVYREIFTGKLYRTENRRITLPTGKEPAQMLILSSPE